MLKTNDLELLNQRVQFEKNVVVQPIDAPVQVELARDGKTAKFFHRNTELLASVERPLMHQLGSRLWITQDFAAINQRWKSTPAQQLEQELASVFQRHDLVVRHYRDVRGVNRVYGFVTPAFVDVNPLDFRQRFIEQIRLNTAISPKCGSLTRDKNGDLMEWFDFQSPGYQTEFRYGLHYARNSGYDAYKVHWGREVIICTNGLKRWESSVSRWKHTRELAVMDFIEETVREGIANQQWLEERIHNAQDTQLAEDIFRELMARLSLAAATKERLHSRVEVEAEVVGRNEWALSQAMTWLGTHDRHMSFWIKQQLTDLGTELLENSLKKVLEVDVKPRGDGRYGIVLPQARNLSA
ncbi:MAG: hypothetical protein PHV02_00155 [Rhodocyclaceae bacterium]|nr:hypothetical protein [Rhodocyclaceae bacterium]